MASSHQNIDIPHSSLANDEAASGVDVEGGCYHLTFAVWALLTKTLPSVTRLLARLVGPAETIFSLYNKNTLEYDLKHIENWRDDANSLIILSGLVSASISGFLAQSYITFQTSSQDVSAFYLSQIYQLQLSLNGTASTPTLAPPVPTGKPNLSHAVWFASLMMSFVSAVGATMVQEWIRRFQLLTQLWSSPHRRSAHIRASLSRDRFLEMVPVSLKFLNWLLHGSIYFFLGGLCTMPYCFDDTPTFSVAFVCLMLALLGYTLVTFGKIFRPNSLFLFPNVLLLRTQDVTLLDYCWLPFTLPTLPFTLPTLPFTLPTLPFTPPSSIFSRWRTLLWVTRNIEEDASTRPSILDADAMSWVLDSLADEEGREQFLAGIPCFYKSTQVEDIQAKDLHQANMETSSNVILAFIDRSLSSDLPEETRRRRIKVSLEAMQAHPYLLHRSFHRALRAYSAKSAIFKSVDFILLADQHVNDDDVDIRTLARHIITTAISRLEYYHADHRWAGIVQRRLNWPEDLFHQEQRDNIKLLNLIHLARELHTPHLNSDTLSPKVLDRLLRDACKLDVGNVAPKLQHEFCDLYNELVTVAQLPGQDPALLSNVMLLLSFIRAVHVSLHDKTEPQLPPTPANTTNQGPALQNPSSYTLCAVSHHPVTPTNPSSNISVALDSGDA